MKRIEPNGTPAFQGDCMFRRVDRLPDGAAKQPRREGGSIVALSETHHHHIATGGDHDLYAVPGDPMHLYLVARGPVQVTHHRSTDTHEAFELLPAGGETIWEIGHQREYVPDGWRQVVD